MRTIQNIYEPYNFTNNPCHIIGIPVDQAGHVKIENKLPDFIKHLTGIFASVNCVTSRNKIVGFLTLNFNQQLTKCLQVPVLRTNLHPKGDHSKPIVFDETILPNSYMQGFFYDSVDLPGSYPYILKIYLHYKIAREK